MFAPFAFLMGVEWADCRLVAELLGLKTFLNEFVAYERLAEIIANRDTGGETISVSRGFGFKRKKKQPIYILFK